MWFCLEKELTGLEMGSFISCRICAHPPSHTHGWAVNSHWPSSITLIMVPMMNISALHWLVCGYWLLLPQGHIERMGRQHSTLAWTNAVWLFLMQMVFKGFWGISSASFKRSVCNYNKPEWLSLGCPKYRGSQSFSDVFYNHPALRSQCKHMICPVSEPMYLWSFTATVSTFHIPHWPVMNF